MSFENNAGTWVGFNNYALAVRGLPSGGALGCNRNNVIFWLIFYTVFTLVFGLVLAVLFGPGPYESIVKSLIFKSHAISSVALAIISIFMFQYSTPGESAGGTLNAIITFLSTTILLVWLQDQWPERQVQRLNNLALIVPRRGASPASRWSSSAR